MGRGIAADRVAADRRAIMINRHPEPLLWMLFSAGGVVSAMLLPAILLVFGVAVPLGWVAPPSYERIAAVLANPLVRLTLIALCVLSLFHWAHRFRHTLYDGLQIKHLNEVIALVSYGLAVVGSVVAVYVIW
jgi:fumarate reductase subunit D